MRLLLSSIMVVFIFASCSDNDFTNNGSKFLTGEKKSADATSGSDFEVGENRKTAGSNQSGDFGDGLEGGSSDGLNANNPLI